MKCPKCGKTEYRHHVIHKGQSIRRDCVCGHFLDFPLWCGKFNQCTPERVQKAVEAHYPDNPFVQKAVELFIERKP